MSIISYYFQMDVLQDECCKLCAFKALVLKTFVNSFLEYTNLRYA